MPISRRFFINQLFISGIFLGELSQYKQNSFVDKNGPIRQFHISLQPEAWITNPDLTTILRNSGITDIWMASFLQGEWYHSPAELRKHADYLKSEGFNPHVLSVPLGHPGNALNPHDDSFSKKKQSWKNASTYDGILFSGTSIHPPVVEENIEVVRLLAEENFDYLFLDDDFRLAQLPGRIGGCFCDECKNEFLTIGGYTTTDWEVLINSVAKRDPSKILKAWIHFICEKTYSMFVSLQKADPRMTVGIMVMYLGAEKAGIALNKYHDVPFRVGELMFDDKSFNRIKGKTDELFSVLFHRRFVKPEMAYSESTAYPEDALSAKNMAAKLNISLISDVRNTMFMSGLMPFNIDYWDTLAPAMKKSARLHKNIAGHKPAGPFKHFWGEDSRIIGTDKPFSLFLASGIPFEVVENLTTDGWIFLSNEDAMSVQAGRVSPKGNNLIVRKEITNKDGLFMQVDETLDDIFAFKKQVIPALRDTPYVDGNIPVIFSWYPTAGKALVWNVTDNRQEYTIMRSGKILHKVAIESLDVLLVSTE